MDFVQQNKAVWELQQQPVFCTTGKIGYSITKRVYDIPELHEKRLLLSKHGWLLLFPLLASSNSSLNFFHPFTGSKTSLPCLDISSLKRPTFALSAPPTSEDCVIFIISCIKDEVGNDSAKTNFCHRRQSVWSTSVISVEDYRISYAVNVVFARRFFYCLRQSGHLSSFGILDHSWTICKVIDSWESRDVVIPPTLVLRDGFFDTDVLWCIESCSPIDPTVVTLNEPIKSRDPLEVLCAEDLNLWVMFSKFQLLYKPVSALLL